MTRTTSSPVNSSSITTLTLCSWPICVSLRFWFRDCVAVTENTKWRRIENPNERHFRKFPNIENLSNRIALKLQAAAVWTINLSRNPATNKQGKRNDESHNPPREDWQQRVHNTHHQRSTSSDMRSVRWHAVVLDGPQLQQWSSPRPTSTVSRT